MADADERTELDRREKGEEGAEDVREEYTSYRKEREGRPPSADDRADDGADEAEREADLQPDEPDAA